MELDNAINEALQNILSIFGITSEYLGVTNESYLTSAAQVNILIGLTNGVKGNIVFGLNKAAALKIVSYMMGGANVECLDEMAESALGELANMIVGTTTGKLSSEKTVEYSPPTLAIGDRMFIVISRVKSRKITYKMDSEILNISFCTE